MLGVRTAVLPRYLKGLPALRDSMGRSRQGKRRRHVEQLLLLIGSGYRVEHCPALQFRLLEFGVCRSQVFYLGIQEGLANGKRMSECGPGILKCFLERCAFIFACFQRRIKLRLLI